MASKDFWNTNDADLPGRTGDPLAAFCRALPGATEDVKWGDDLVFSVGTKMFAAFDLEDAHEFAFKCDPDTFLRLTQIDGIIPAPYAARFNWVKVKRRGVLRVVEAKRLLWASYDLVLAQLPARLRAEIAAIPSKTKRASRPAKRKPRRR